MQFSVSMELVWLINDWNNALLFVHFQKPRGNNQCENNGIEIEKSKNE